MSHAPILLSVVLAGLLSADALAQTQPPSLDRLVSVERQRVLGLDTLTASQRAGLALLLQETYRLGFQEAQARKAPAPKPPTPDGGPSTSASVIESRIDGDFEGWEGDTVVSLTNGQIWKQTEYHYTYHYAYSPRVVIYRSGGSYKMKVDGVERAISVERLK